MGTRVEAAFKSVRGSRGFPSWLVAAVSDKTYLASARLPHPGRPRKVEVGHVSGTSDAGGHDGGGQHGRALALHTVAPLAPRLLDVHGLAAYLGLPEATVYDLAARGVLLRVRIPLPNGEEMRKLLFDREDVDRLIDAWKDQGGLSG